MKCICNNLWVIGTLGMVFLSPLTTVAPDLHACGDVNCDGYYLTIPDLMSWMDYTSYLYAQCENMGCDTTWFECATRESDMNGDGYPWTTSDLVRFHRYFVRGGPPCDTIEPLFSDLDSMRVLDSGGPPGDTVLVSINLLNTFPVYGCAFRIVYDSTLMRAIGANTGRGWLVGYGSCNFWEPLPPGSASIAQVAFAVNSNIALDTITYLTFEDDTIMAEFYNSLSDSVGTHVVPQLIPGKFRIVPYACGDCNGDGRITVTDATYLVAFIYRGGSVPVGQADVNLDGRFTIADATYIAGFLYRGGPSPCEPPLEF